MGDTFFSNSIYSDTKPDRPPNYEDSVYSGPQRPQRSVYSARTGASAYSHVTKKSSDFYRSDASSFGKKAPLTQRIAQFVWNPDEGEVLGRTPVSWLRLLLYHAALYAVVALVWAASFAFYDFAVLDEDKPVRTGYDNSLRLNPSLSFYPQPDHYTSLIRYRTSRLSSVRKYVDDIVAVTQWYEDHALQNVITAEETVQVCTKDTVIADPQQTVCKFDLNVGKRCNAYKNFGFVDGDPCIVLKLNRVYGWVPDPVAGPAANASGVIVRCRGRTPTDQDFIGRICYHFSTDGDDGSPDFCNTQHGVFEHYYFPYLRQIRYMSPLVFVEFQRVARNVVVMVECEAEAKNIQVDRTYRIGVVQFELLID